MDKQSFVYIMASKKNGTLYVGITSDIVKRVYEHRNNKIPGFTSQYGCKYLVYYEEHGDILEAISREKQIKSGSRQKKITLIEEMNFEWRDLYETLL